DLEAASLELDLSPFFPSAWQLEDVALVAEASDDFSILALNRVAANIDGVTLQSTGELEFIADPAPDQLPISLSLSAETIGDVSKDLVMSFWPETLGDGARRFIVANMESGLVTEAKVQLNLTPESLESGYLRNEDLDVRFSFQDGRVRFLSDVPPVSNGVGTARLRGNSFSLELLSGSYDDWDLTNGIFEFPAFNPRGGSLLVSAEGSGPIKSILNHLNESRLKLEENTGFDPDRLSGTGQAQFYMERPALTNVPFEDVVLRVTGDMREASLTDVALGLDLRNATAQLDLTGERMIVSGFGDLGSAPVQFSWRDGLAPDETPAALSASAIVTPDVLNAFGLMGRAYLSGEIPVEIQGQVGGAGLGEATFGMDLREARISIDEIGWTKPAGEAARATLIYAGDAERSASTVRLESERAKLDGDLRLAADGRLEELVLRRLFVDGAADVAGTISRTGPQGLAFQLTGDFLDVSPLISDLDAFGGAAEAEALGIGLNIDASVNRLRLRRGLELTDAEVKLNNAVDRLLSMEARGTTPDGASLAASYFALDPDEAPTIGLTSSDAGFLAQAFLGVDFIRGGEMRLSGTLGQEGRPTRLTARIADARLENAPFITQILSLASLRGLADTLSGDGVLFSEVVAPLRIGNGRYVIEGGRASGPALGLTMNGFVGTTENEIELDGVLVPSFGVNSMLGGVPVIGDLFVGREGEGIFSITYSVTGSLDRAQVAVNPLSAVTPGILRRIFENPSDTSIPASLPTDPDLKPPTEKLPELPDDEFIESAPGAG
ncbi:MAG: AsmA-like C-terminal region-containing protein, partial [Pseudomonadota bacterium]